MCVQNWNQDGMSMILIMFCELRFVTRIDKTLKYRELWGVLSKSDVRLVKSSSHD